MRNKTCQTFDSFTDALSKERQWRSRNFARRTTFDRGVVHTNGLMDIPDNQVAIENFAKSLSYMYLRATEELGVSKKDAVFVISVNSDTSAELLNQAKRENGENPGSIQAQQKRADMVHKVLQHAKDQGYLPSDTRVVVGFFDEETPDEHITNMINAGQRIDAHTKIGYIASKESDKHEDMREGIEGEPQILAQDTSGLVMGYPDLTNQWEEINAYLKQVASLEEIPGKQEGRIVPAAVGITRDAEEINPSSKNPEIGE